MFTISSTEARHNWSSIVDQVVREKPAFIKRTRDHMILSSTEVFEGLLIPYVFTAQKFVEDNGSVTLSLNEIDLAENGETYAEAKRQLAQSILEYAEDYYKDFNLYSNSPNRKGHIPYVFKALITDDINKIGELIQCQNGEN